MRTGQSVEEVTDLGIFDLSAFAPVPEHLDSEVLKQQRAWLDQLIPQLKKSFSPFQPKNNLVFKRDVEGLLRAHFGMGQLDLLRRENPDEPPRPEALSQDAPLLFGRGQRIHELTQRIFGQGARLSLIEGVSGAGKSSLLRAGLMRQWYKEHPKGLGRRAGSVGLLVEPNLLQLEEGIDPLATSGRLLTSSDAQCDAGVVGPLPGPLAGPLGHDATDGSDQNRAAGSTRATSAQR